VPLTLESLAAFNNGQKSGEAGTKFGEEAQLRSFQEAIFSYEPKRRSDAEVTKNVCAEEMERTQVDSLIKW
jgi:hypothetical protein